MNKSDIIRNIESLFNFQKKLISIHKNDYRFLLPKTVNHFNKYKKFTVNDKSYDLYGWYNNSIIDIYPTYNNILNEEDLPESWKIYLNEILDVTKIDNIKLIIYNKKYKLYSNVLTINKKENKNTFNIETNHKIDDKWIKATGTKNYILDDPILDKLNKIKKQEYIELCKKVEENKSDEEQNCNVYNQNENKIKNEFDDDELIRINLGHKFEAKRINDLIENYYMDFCKIGESYQARDNNKYIETMKQIKLGTPIIHQAVLHDSENKLFGCVDLLIRYDYLNKIFKNMEFINNDKENQEKKQQHTYVIVDIKFHRIQFNVDDKTIRNEGMMKVFKSQLWIYNKILGKMQGFMPREAYILGRGWMKSRTVNKEMIVEKNNDPFDKVGTIDYYSRDQEICNLTMEAINWLRELEKVNLEDKEQMERLNKKYMHEYPNMNNSLDSEHRKRKRSIADDINELTDISYISTKHRKIGIEKGIDNYKVQNINASKIGINGKTGEIVNALLNNFKIEREIDGNYKMPVKDDVEIFLDYEFFDDLDDNDDRIPYLCGIGYVINDEWKFEYELLEDVKEENRKKMCKNILEKIKRIKELGNQNKVRIFHWSPVDKQITKKQCKKYGLEEEEKELGIEWVDGYYFCKDNYINFKNCKGYGLKEIGRAIKENNLTDIDWKYKLGKIGSVMNYYLFNGKWNSKRAIEYNEVDCLMMYEIIKNLRKYEK